MDRTAALNKIRKLEALAGDQAATPGEAATARQMAQRLRQRHGIRTSSSSSSSPPPRRASHPPPPAGGFSMFGSRDAFIKAFDDAMQDFNPNTGEAKSDRVHVRYYRDRANWRIDLDI